LLFLGDLTDAAPFLLLSNEKPNQPKQNKKQAIDKLEEMLNGGMRAGGKTNMFGPREYVAIYT